MPKTKKKFIDRKKAVTFNLVHRSQQDPLAADETAPQRVLVPVNANVPARKEKDPDLTLAQRKQEQQKYGIYFDDDYNYLQHLKDTREVTLVVAPKVLHKRKEKVLNKEEGELDSDDDDDDDAPVSKLQLPSSVFASEVEERVGLLNRNAPQGLCLDLDPDVIAALDEDFDFDDPDNELEDNFIELADADNGDDSDGMSDDDGSERAFASDLDDGDDDDSDAQRGEGNWPRMPSWSGHDADETKSRFSQYSMSSSVIRRNQGLSLLDDRFEKIYAEYDDTELGPLDLEEIEGFMPDTHARLLEAAEEFEEMKRKKYLDKERERDRIRRLQEIEEESEEEIDTVEVEPKEKWDCETILSTYSNLYNHPKIIEEPKKLRKIQIDAKSGIPKDVLGKDNKLTVKSLAKFNAMHDSANGTNSDEEGRTNAETVLSTLSVLSIRAKDETPEEKKERKHVLKAYRKERRIEKKANKEAFKEEKKRQEKIMLNNRNNVQGNKIF